MALDVDDIIAHAVYDPVARRQRYLKTRQLKGRQKGTAPQPAPKAGVGSRVVETGRSDSSLHPSGQVNRTKAAQAASNARQVAAIQGRLGKLKAHLNELLAKKKTESKSSSSSDSSKSETKDSTKASSEPKTAKQKAAAKEALKKAQKERAKDQKAEPNKPDTQEGGTSLSLDEQITKTRAVITDVETKLRAAINSARTQTASNGR